MTREEARNLLKQLDREDLRKLLALAKVLDARYKAEEEKISKKAV